MDRESRYRCGVPLPIDQDGRDSADDTGGQTATAQTVPGSAIAASGAESGGESAQPADAVAPNEQVGRYVVRGLLGTGSMGIVLSAYDPVLARKVALKLLLPSGAAGTTQGASRLEVEAQAMARLSHPNVVAVYEVDRVGDRTFIAMELVEGSTLRGWLRERPRGWREIVEMFVAAGRGLAAAHAAGLVHRDFKPDNVLIGRDGRPRVSDFGIVASTSEPLAAGSEPTGDAPMHRSSGTPGYMPAEQWAGRPVDARSDQFAYCVALWEALWRRRPFPGETRGELRAAVEAGALVEPPSEPRVPRRLVAALRRGLASDPAARWPDLGALLDTLARAAGGRRRWTVVAVAAAAAVVSAATAATIAGAGQAAAPCAPPAARLAAVWNVPRAVVLSVRLGAADPAHGALRAAKIAAVLDRGAQSWSAMHVEACRATRLDGRQSDALLDLRMGCLDRWLGELASTVAAVEKAASPTAVDRAVHAAAEMSPLSTCADARALTEAVPPPAGATERATARALERRAQELEIAQRTGRLDGLPDQVRELVAAARALDHAPTLAAALAVEARVAFTRGSNPEPILRELSEVAARARDDRNVAFAWTQLIMTLANRLGKRDEALALVPAASAAVLRAGDTDELRAELLYVQGSIVDTGPKPAEGLALLVEARLLFERAAQSSPAAASRLADVIFETGSAHLSLGDADAAIASCRDAIERWRALFGPDSPDEAFGWQNMGWALQKSARYDEALAAYRTAARIREARLGASPQTAAALVAVASVLQEQRKSGEALAMYDRALAIYRAQLGPGDLEHTGPLLGRADALSMLGRLDESERSYTEAIAAYEPTGAKDNNLAIALYSRGLLSAKRERCDAALADHDRAAAVFEELEGPRSTYLIYPLIGKGRCLIDLGRAAEAIPVLERALRLPADARDAREVAGGRLYLGRAQIETGRDARGGLAMIRAARTEIAASGDGDATVRELDLWLAARARAARR
jgi:tetratricopeptide (TPR) repeat protein